MIKRLFIALGERLYLNWKTSVFGWLVLLVTVVLLHLGKLDIGPGSWKAFWSFTHLMDKTIFLFLVIVGFYNMLRKDPENSSENERR